MLNGEGRIVLTPPLWKLVQQAQRDGNKVIWTPDNETWGVVERWEFPKEVGKKKLEDCDGITLYKMRDLLQHGFPAACLLFTICSTEENEIHAVLCVETDRGDFILDNRQDEVMGYDALKNMGYDFLYRSQPGKSMTDSWDKVD